METRFFASVVLGDKRVATVHKILTARDDRGDQWREQKTKECCQEEGPYRYG